MTEFNEIQVNEVKHCDTGKMRKIFTVMVKEETIQKHIKENNLEQLQDDIIQKLSIEIRDKIK